MCYQRHVGLFDNDLVLISYGYLQNTSVITVESFYTILQVAKCNVLWLSELPIWTFGLTVIKAGITNQHLFQKNTPRKCTVCSFDNFTNL